MIRRLGVLGGTFDPIHHGHLVAAEEVHYQLGLDLVLLVPARTPPHKRQQPISPPDHRLKMVELAIGDNPHLAVSRVDMDRAGPCYTADTLAILRAQCTSVSDLFFIEGADSLADILTWYQPQRLIELCDLAVVARPGVEVDLEGLERQLPGLTRRVHWVPTPRLEISSSDLRARVREGRPISYLVPPAVQAYILEHKLYRQ